MFDSFERGVSQEDRRELPARWGRSTGAVPALDRDFLHTAHRDPDVAGRDASRERLLGRAVTELDDDSVAQQHASEVAELIGDGAGELAELQEKRP